MTLIIVGLLLFTGTHLVPALVPGARQALVARLGEGGYKGIYTLLALGGIVLIVLGWRGSVPQHVYMLPIWTRHAAMLLAVIAFLLIGAANYPSRMRRVLRHPMLTGVALWACAHLIINGDSRSILLFGWLGLWALLEILLINRRDPDWQKIEAGSLAVEIRGLAISLVVVGVVIYIHPWLAGVAIF